MNRTALIFVLALPALTGAAFAQSGDDARAHAVDQLVGNWTYETCAAESDCQTVERSFEPAAGGELYYFTETAGEEEREGFMSYDEEAGAFVEYDYPQDWSRDEFEQSYYSEDSDRQLHGAYDLDGGRGSLLQWRMNEDGSAMSVHPLGETVEGNPVGALGVVFSKVPIVGSDPLVGPGSND